MVLFYILFLTSHEKEKSNSMLVCLTLSDLSTPSVMICAFIVCSNVCPCSCICVFVLCKDIDQWEKLSNVIGDSCSLLSDITFKSKAPPLPGVRGHILKHIHETTVYDMIHITSEHQGNRSNEVR